MIVIFCSYIYGWCLVLGAIDLLGTLVTSPVTNYQTHFLLLGWAFYPLLDSTFFPRYLSAERSVDSLQQEIERKRKKSVHWLFTQSALQLLMEYFVHSAVCTPLVVKFEGASCIHWYTIVWFKPAVFPLKPFPVLGSNLINLTQFQHDMVYG